jgi:hypothetical protein
MRISDLLISSNPKSKQPVHETIGSEPEQVNEEAADGRNDDCGGERNQGPNQSFEKRRLFWAH